jgi:hypothetical protein
MVVADSPPTYEYSWDRYWFDTSDRRLGYSAAYDAATDVDWALVHEFMHGLDIIDMYTVGIEVNDSQARTKDGAPLNFAFGWPIGDLWISTMAGGYLDGHTDGHNFDSHTAAAFNVNKGYRRGYYGAYLFDVPQQVYLRLLDNQGSPAAGVNVRLYRQVGRVLDATPDFTGTTDPAGTIQLPNVSVGGTITTRNGHTLRDNPWGIIDVVGFNAMTLLSVSRGDHEEFHWLNLIDYNLAYWAGNMTAYTTTIRAFVPAVGAPPSPTSFRASRVEGCSTVLAWDPSSSPNGGGYNLYHI